MAEADTGGKFQSSPGEAGALRGRESELRALDGLLQGASDRLGRIGLLEGQAGIGKSCLLAAARVKGAKAGFQILRARGSELEREFPFGVARQLFETALVRPQTRVRWLAGAAAIAGPVFAPAEPNTEDAGQLFAVLHGLYWLTVNAATDGPLLLAIDDVQWCDKSSLRFLAYLAHRLEDLPVLILAGVRVGEKATDPALLAQIADDPVTTVIRPGPLSVAAVAGLIGDRLGTPPDTAFTAECHRATGGNPLLLHELLRALATNDLHPDSAHVGAISEVGPQAVSRTVPLRLARLHTDAIAVARAVAVAGEGADLRLVMALAELDESRATVAARALGTAEILRPNWPVGFVHPLVGDAVYQDLTPTERELWHARAARILRADGAAHERVAAHLLAVSPRGDEQVVEGLQRAGRVAMRHGAADSAVAYLRRALAEPPIESDRTEVLYELGMAEALVNAPHSAREHLQSALDTLTDPVTRAVAAQALARMMLFTRSAQDAMQIAKAAAGGLPERMSDVRQSLEAVEEYAVSFGASAPRGGARLRLARDSTRTAGPGTRMLTAVAAWDWALTGGTANECAALARTALSDGQLVAADPALFAGVAASVLILADGDDVVPVLDAITAEAHRSGSLFADDGLTVVRGWAWLQRGELAEAEQALRLPANENTPQQADGSDEVGYAAAILARILIERGDLPAARRALTGCGTPQPGSDADGLCQRSALELLLAEGDFAAADDLANEYGVRQRQVVNPGWAPWRSLKALALRGLGHEYEAANLLEQELASARKWGAPATLGRSLRLMGTARDTNGIDLLQEAVDTTADTTARLEHAKSLAALGAALRHARRPVDARRPLRAAAELATRCGAVSLVRQARAELAAAGGRYRNVSLTGVGSLTPSERRVAQLAADGHSNNGIAQTLFVTPKTVEAHLSSAYRKLGIAARNDLPEALASA